MRVVLLLIVVAVLGVVGWKKREEIPFLRDAARQVEKVEVPKVRLGDDGPSIDRNDGAIPPAPTGVRRCVVNGSVLYTNDACPAGSAEHKVKGGTMTVMPGYKAPAAPGSASSGIPNARDLLKPDETLKEKMRDRAMEGV